MIYYMAVNAIQCTAHRGTSIYNICISVKWVLLIVKAKYNYAIINCTTCKYLLSVVF